MPLPPTIRPVPPSSPSIRHPQPARPNPLALVHTLRGRPLLHDIQKQQKELQGQQRQLYYGPPRIDPAVTARRYSRASKQAQQEQYVPYSRASAYQQRYLLENGPGAHQYQKNHEPETLSEVKENLFVPSGCLRWDSMVAHGKDTAMAPLCCGPNEDNQGFDFYLTDRTPFRAFHCNSLTTTLVTRKFYLTKIHGKTFPFPNNMAYKFTDASIARVQPDTKWWSIPHGCDGEEFADSVCPCPQHAGRRKVDTIPEEPGEEEERSTPKQDGKVWAEVRKFEDKENSDAPTSRMGTKSNALVLRDRSVNLTVSSRFSYTPDMPLSTPLASSTAPSSPVPSSPPPLTKKYPNRTPSLAKRAPTQKPKREPSNVLEGRYRRTCEKEYTPILTMDESGNCDFTIFEGMSDNGETFGLKYASTSKSLRSVREPPPPRPEARIGHYEPVSSSSLLSTSKSLRRQPTLLLEDSAGFCAPVSSSSIVSMTESVRGPPPPRPEARTGYYEPVTSSRTQDSERGQKRDNRESSRSRKRESRTISEARKPNYDAPVLPLKLERKDEPKYQAEQSHKQKSHRRTSSGRRQESCFDQDDFNFPQHLKHPPQFPPIEVPPEHFPYFTDLTGITIYGSVLIPALLLGSHFPCLIPALLVSEIPFPEDTEHQLWDQVDVALGNDFTTYNPLGETYNDSRYTRKQEHLSMTYPFRTNITSSPMPVPTPVGFPNAAQPVRTLHIRCAVYAGPSSFGEIHIPNTFHPLSDEAAERGPSVFTGYGIIFDNSQTSGANLSITHFTAITEIEHLYEPLAWGRVIRRKPKAGEPDVPVPIEYRRDLSSSSDSETESENEDEEEDEELRLRRKLGKPIKNIHGFTAGSIHGPKTATTQKPVHQILCKLGRTLIPDLIKYFPPLPRILDWSVNGSVRGELCMGIIAIIRALKLRDTLGYWWDCLIIETTSQFLISLFGENKPPPLAPLSPPDDFEWTSHWESLGLGKTLEMNRDLVCVLGFLIRQHNVTFTLVKRTEPATIVAEGLAKVAADGYFDAPLDFGEGIAGVWDFKDEWDPKEETWTIEVGNALAGWMIPPGCCAYEADDAEKEEVIKADRRALRARIREARRKRREMRAQEEARDAEEQLARIKDRAFKFLESAGWGSMTIVEGLEGYDLEEWHKAGRLGELVEGRLRSMEVEEEEKRKCEWMEGLERKEDEMRRLRESMEAREAQKMREEGMAVKKRRFRSVARRVKVRVGRVMRR